MFSSLRPLVVRQRSFPADLSSLREMLAFILDEGSGALCGTAGERLEVACEEILVNVIAHGYQGTAGVIDLSVSVDDEQVEVEISDLAPPFDPLVEQEVETSEERLGGYGLRIVKKMVDAVTYTRKEGKNILRLTVLLR